MVSIIDIYKTLFGRKGIKDGNVIEMAEHGRAGGLSSGQGFKYTRNVEEKTAIDAVDSSTTYIGKAKQGTATSADDWQIKKILTSGSITTISYAGGTDTYDKVWDDRDSYSYS